jgi:hypothetical protein
LLDGATDLVGLIGVTLETTGAGFPTGFAFGLA